MHCIAHSWKAFANRYQFNLFLGLFILAPTLSLAQTCPYPDSVAVADTLDPKGYYPVAVGNVWEYQTMDGSFLVSLTHEEIVADTLIGADQFFVLQRTSYDVDTTVTFSIVSEQFLMVTDSSVIKYNNGSFEETDLRFNAHFKSCYEGASIFGFQEFVIVGESGGNTLSFVEEGFPVEYETGAVKDFDISILGGRTYAHGFGLIRGTADVNVEGNLVYAKLDAVEYGTTLSSTYALPVGLSEDLNLESTTLSVYPNPASDDITIRVGTDKTKPLQIRMIDVLGRIVWNSVIEYSGQVQTIIYTDVSHFSPGLYIISVPTSTGQVVTKSIIVVN